MSEVLFHTIEGNKVFLNETAWFAKRELATVSDESKLPHTIGFLTDKFSELQDELKLLLADYTTATDKVRLAGKISRVKNLFGTSKAIGDFKLLFEPLEACEKEILETIKANVAAREAILAEAEEVLKNASTNFKGSTEKIGTLSKSLKELAIVPDVRVEEIRVRFDQIKDEFFAKKQGHFDDNEKILLDNLAHKLELCEKAEALQNSTEWKKTTEAITAINEEWKKIGPIPRHRNDELWLRFNAAKDVFFAAKKQHYEVVRNDQEKSLEIKLQLIEKAEALKDSRDWKKTTDAYAQLLEEWKKSGRAPEDKNDEVWNKFNEARGAFFNAKEEYYSSIKFNLEENYARKMAIVTRVEEIANSSIVDWEGTTAEVLEMTDDWKKIGRIPKEHGDGPWERFLAAKKKFFDAKDADRAKRRSEGSKVLDDKIKRGRGYYNKLRRELDLEQEVLWDFEHRLKNLPPGIRTFETKERYENIVADAQKKVDFLQKKINDLKANLDADEKEFRFLNRTFTKKEKPAAEGGADAKGKKPKQAASTDESAKQDDITEASNEVVASEQGNAAAPAEASASVEQTAAVTETETSTVEEVVTTDAVVESNEVVASASDNAATETAAPQTNPSVVLELPPTPAEASEASTADAVTQATETQDAEADTQASDNTAEATA
ncbi:MAG: hypothetical protein RL660_11 [Bacteroidota bacterium]|jgi:hypothetical protein